MNVRTGEVGTLIGALTTTWTPPKSCTVNFQVCSTCDGLFAGQECIRDPDPDGSPLQDNYECFPPRNSKINSAKGHPLMGWGYYSPGLACPTGYTTACSATGGGSKDWDVQFELRPGEMAIGCCPEGFACTNRFGNTCLAMGTDGLVIPTATCSGTEMAGSTMATLSPDTITITDKDDKVITTERIYSVYAPMFQLNFHSSDLETTSSDPKPGPTTEPPAQSTSSGNPEPTGSNDSGGGGLSTGAAAGIGAGVAVAGVALIFAIAFFIWRRRRRHREGSMSGGNMGVAGSGDGPEKYHHMAAGGASGYMRQGNGMGGWQDGHHHNNYEMQPNRGGSMASGVSPGGQGYGHQNQAAYGNFYEPYKSGSPHGEMDGNGKPVELGGDVPVELPSGR